MQGLFLPLVSVTYHDRRWSLRICDELAMHQQMGLFRGLNCKAGAFLARPTVLLVATAEPYHTRQVGTRMKKRRARGEPYRAHGFSNHRQQKEAVYEVKLPIYRGPCNGSSLRLNKFYGWVGGDVAWCGCAQCRRRRCPRVVKAEASHRKQDRGMLRGGSAAAPPAG